MWTTRKIRTGIGDHDGAGAAARYALDPSDSPLAFSPDSGDGAEIGPVAYWLGSEVALGKLGLTPGQKVELGDLQLALQGRGVDGGQVRRPGLIERPLRDERRRLIKSPEGKTVTKRELGVVTHRFTFSPPKSVSFVWSQAPEAIKRKIERAMLESWNLAAEHMIRSHDVVMQGRDENGDRPYGPATGFAAAVSLHATARQAKDDPAPAPQLHVEGTMIGVTRDDGKLAAINSAAIFGDAALEAGAYARAHLAQRLVEMGFQIIPSTGRDGLYFEIRGVPEDLIKLFSGRSVEVEAAVAAAEQELGRVLKSSERAELALLTRAPKRADTSPHLTASWWLSAARERGFGPGEFDALLGKPGFELDPEQARESLAAAVESSMRKRGPAVSRTAARALVMAAAPGRMTVAGAEAMIADLEQSGSLMTLEDSWVTTPSIRAKELEVMGIIKQVGARPRNPYSAEAMAAGRRLADRKLGERELSPAQITAIDKLGEGAGWSVLNARAGTGKTAVLQAITEAHRSDGGNVIGCAIDWRTAQELAEDIEAEPFSLRRAIRWARQGRVRVDSQTLIVVEEAGKIGLPEWSHLTELVKRTRARVLLAGHIGQMGAIELPGMFEQMVGHPELVQLAGLGDVVRHDHAWMRDLQIAIDTGNGAEAVRILDAHQAITFHATRAEAVEAMIDDWFVAQRERGGEHAAMIIDGSNEEIDEINAQAQERRLVEKQLSGVAVKAPDRPYGFYAGDRVVLRGSAYRFELDAQGRRERAVENGTAGVVRRVDPAARRMWVEVDEPGADPRVVQIDLSRKPVAPERADLEWGESPEWEDRKEQFAPPSWRLGYAMHTSFTQGMSIRSVNHLGGHPSQDRESSYVALSRMISELHDHVSCETFNGETKEEWMAEYARVLSRSRRRQASIAYGEDPDAKIATDSIAGHALPEGVHEDLEPRRARSLGERLDPLAAHRGLLGAERAALIEERADRYAGAVARMDATTLHDERATMREAFEVLDSEGALQTLRLQRDRKQLEHEITTTRRHIETLEWRARTAEEREYRDFVLEVAETQRRLAQEDMESRQELLADEAELRRKGIHLDGWLHDHGDAAARYVALERELFSRREQRLEDEIEHSLREPRPEIVALVGPAPEVEDPAREEWEDVVYELEANRLIAEDELPAAMPTVRDMHELERRVEALRLEREVGPELADDPAQVGWEM